MKTIFVAIAFFSLQCTTVFAENTMDNNDLNESHETIGLECADLIPQIPQVATFDDQEEIYSLMIHASLKPEIPAQADFLDAF